MRTITSNTGQVRGRLDEGTQSLLYVYDKDGRALGFFNQNTNTTHTNSGQYVGKGDQRMLLLTK